MPECTVQLWFNKQRVKKSGNASLYLQLIVDAEHEQVRLKKLEWPADKFDWSKKALLPRFKDDPDYLTYVAVAERERAKYWKVVMNFLQRDVPFTLSDIFREVNLYQDGHQFCAFMENAIRARQKTQVKKDMIKGSTANGPHRTSLKIFRAFLNDQDLEIIQIDSELLRRFAEYLSKTMGEPGVWVKIQNIKSYLSYAARNKVAVNPDYKNFTMTLEEKEPVWLEEDEVGKLMELYKNPDLGEEHRRNLRAFLFACFTGLRISDLKRWNKDWLKGDSIVFEPQKKKKSIQAKRIVRIPIIPAAEQFIADLKEQTFELPVDQVYNRGLKALAPMAGIDKNLTSHVARHTFATWMAMLGSKTIFISSLLGHRSPRTTERYTHVAEKYLGYEMMKLQNKFGGKDPTQ